MTNLERAAQLIEDHIATLNTSSTECPCCQMVRYENWFEYMAEKELSGMARKLRTRFRPKD